MKFIRKNGRIIPIKEKGENEKVPSESEINSAINKSMRKTTTSERVSLSSQFGAMGAVAGGLAGLVVVGGSKKSAAIGAGVVGALGALYGATRKKIADRKTIEKNLKKKKK